MLSKCANPTCLSRFRYLHEGRIFNIVMAALSSESNRAATRKIEHFWLCERCAQTFTVVLENGLVSTRPLHLELTEGAPKKTAEKNRHVA